MLVQLPAVSLRPNGIVHGGALATAIGAGAIALVGRAFDVIALRVQFLRAVTGLQLSIRQTSLGEREALVAVELVDQIGPCVSGIVRLVPSAQTRPTPSTARADPPQADIGEPWRRLLGLDITVSGEDACSMAVSSFPLDEWWAPVAYAATFADGPGAMLAHERAAGAEFVTTTLTLDLEQPLGVASGLTARGWRVGAGGRFRSFASQIMRGDNIIGFGTANYYQVR
jgi:hypothetical protein